MFYRPCARVSGLVKQGIFIGCRQEMGRKGIKGGKREVKRRMTRERRGGEVNRFI